MNCHSRETGVAEEDQQRSDAEAELLDQSKTASVDRIFELTVNSAEFNHDRHIRDPQLNPLWGNFRPDTRSAFSAYLERTLPKKIWTKGLADWQTDSMRRRKWVEERFVGQGKTTVGIVGAAETTQMPRKNAAYRKRQDLPPRLQRLAEQQEKEKRALEMPKAMKGLQKLYLERELGTGDLQARGQG